MPIAFDWEGIMDGQDFLSEERDSTCDRCQCHTATSEFTSAGSLCSRSFSVGVAVGRSLQRDQGRRVLYRYQDLVRNLKRKHEEEILLCERYRFEAEALQQEMSDMKDRLLAMQIAYEELTVVATDPILHQNSSRNSAQHAGDPELMQDMDTIESYQHCNDDIGFSTDSTISSDSDDFDTLQQLQVMEELGQSDHLNSLDESRYYTTFCILNPNSKLLYYSVIRPKCLVLLDRRSPSQNYKGLEPLHNRSRRNLEDVLYHHLLLLRIPATLLPFKLF